MTSVDDMEFRMARPEDTEAIEALDGSFTTRTVFQVAVTADGFTLREIPVDPPVHKVFPAESGDEDDGDGSDAAVEEDPNSRTFVAVGSDGCLAGFASVSYTPWNRRLVIDDFEVAPPYRRLGVGRALVSRAAEFARERGAGHLWLEVTNINAPAIHAYRRMGFVFCGLDTMLYAGTPSSGEHALYMSMPCP
ncbi:GNAT family N-acetyltransferase [Streptomyces griseosporeus]|uniref:GNAT family N-acetyltransferase n=1 Tax=Streptomyces griseosporeus TaxID=1910 RepID=UPI00370234BC